MPLSSALLSVQPSRIILHTPCWLWESIGGPYSAVLHSHHRSAAQMSSDALEVIQHERLYTLITIAQR